MMSVSTQTVTSFAEEAQILVQIAANIGEYRQQDRREDFNRALEAMDMGDQEIAQYWDLIPFDPNNPTPRIDPDTIDWSKIKSNSDVTHLLSISLNSAKNPRNLLLYRLMELHFPDFFAVAVKGTVHMGGEESRGNPPQRRIVSFPKQPVGTAANGKIGVMSVHRVLRGVEPSQFSERVLKAAAPLRAALGNTLGFDLAELLIACKMEIPERLTAAQLGRVLEAGKKGEPVTLVGTFCPDYAYEETGDPHLPYRYTFDGISDSVGLVAQQFVRIVPAISEFFNELGMEYRFVLGIGDFEANSEEILKQVGLDREEFLRRCQGSLDSFAASMPAGLPIELEMLYEKRSHGRLERYTKLAIDEMMAGRFGRMAELHEGLQSVLNRIPRQYRTFYERWYGRAMQDLEVSEIVFGQGAEYAAVARIYAEDFGDNTIMLAGDRPEMHRFNAFFSRIPTLCAKRAY